VTIIKPLLVAVFAVATFAAAAAASYNGISLVTSGDVFNAVDVSDSITVAAYAMSPTSVLARKLAAASDRGATVAVSVDGHAFGGAARSNDELARMLSAHNVRIHYTDRPSHIKAAVINGVVYLADRNFVASRNEIVVQDSIPQDRPIVERAMLGFPGSNDHLWTRKADALAAEARVLATRASRNVDFESESFGAGTPVFTQLMHRAKMGDTVRVLLGESIYRESMTSQHAAQLLMRAHVSVRLTTANEKMLIDGPDVFFGSANATRGIPDQMEFGIAMRDQDLATKLREKFGDEWTDARTP